MDAHRRRDRDRGSNPARIPQDTPREQPDAGTTTAASAKRPADDGEPRHQSIERPMRVALAIIGLLLGLAAIFSFRSVILSALIGVMIGVLPEPWIRWLRGRWGLPRAASALTIGVVTLALFAGLGYAIYATLVPEVSRLAQQAPSIMERLNQTKDAWVSRLPWLNLDPQQIDVGSMLQGGTQLVFAGLSVGAGGLAALAVIVMIAIFVTSNYAEYGRGVLTLVPQRRRPRLREMAIGSAGILRRWFVGHMIVVTVSGVLTGIAMAVIGIDFWLLIAALTVVLDFIPFIGAIITGAVAVVLTLGTDPDRVVWVLVAFVAIQQIESNVVLPIVMKESIRLPEAHLLVFVVIMGTAFGIIGVFVAPPMFAVLHHLYTEAYIPWMEGRHARDPATRPSASKSDAPPAEAQA